ncbi:membrane protein [Streptomyces sp. MUSC 125]|uniref:DUF4129 domain-containing protein n=1 Tax=unclassified Streptomyces TaxID=2593676 RepID=UPI00057E9F9A|nr:MULTISPECIES: DUF4129 domain-containing protein [unclassified Streptomyces]KIE28913.1 membrane protein [Streptomyces sp. MUSC 125]MCH0560572.1 DUF4129 domain-containing protein [Streptomyces sp. MUM 16J]
MSVTGGILTAAQPGTVGTAVRGLLRAAGNAVPAADGSGNLPPVTIPRAPAQDAARHELAKRMYHENDPGLFERTLNAFWHWLDKLFSTASSATPGGTVGLLVVVLAVVAVLTALWWRLGVPRRQPASSAVLFDDRPRSAAEHRSASEAHAAQGHWNQAVQERMRAIVRSLEERALLDARPGRTADEAAAEAGRALPAHTDRLRAAAAEFDDVTYGGRSMSEEPYRRVAELDRDLERTRPVVVGETAGSAPSTHRGAAE